MSVNVQRPRQPTERVEVLRDLFRKGLVKAAESLSAMVGQEIVATDGRIEILSLADAISLAGPADRAMVGVYVGLTGHIEAHIILLFSPGEARRLVELLLLQTCGTTEQFESMARPALGELGNVTGSSFATTLGDLLGSPIWSTAPRVRVDMAPALIDELIATACGQESQVLVGATTFSQPDVKPPLAVQGRFLFVPEPDGILTLLEALDPT